mgnify:CR=1 FL=1
MHSGLKPHSVELSEISTSRRQSSTLFHKAVAASPVRHRESRTASSADSLEYVDGSMRMTSFVANPVVSSDSDNDNDSVTNTSQTSSSTRDSEGLSRKRFFELCGLVGAPYVALFPSDSSTNARRRNSNVVRLQLSQAQSANQKASSTSHETSCDYVQLFVSSAHRRADYDTAGDLLFGGTPRQ